MKPLMFVTLLSTTVTLVVQFEFLLHGHTIFTSWMSEMVRNAPQKGVNMVVLPVRYILWVENILWCFIYNTEIEI